MTAEEQNVLFHDLFFQIRQLECVESVTADFIPLPATGNRKEGTYLCINCAYNISDGLPVATRVCTFRDDAKHILLWLNQAQASSILKAVGVIIGFYRIANTQSNIKLYQTGIYSDLLHKVCDRDLWELVDGEFSHIDEIKAFLQGN